MSPCPLNRLTLALGMLMAYEPGIAGMGAPASLLELRLEELIQVTVTSVPKKAQRLDETAAAAFVISAEDIHRSSATNVPEALRLAPGLQVAAIGHNKWAVSMLGFNTRFTGKLLVLVDSRTIYSTTFSGMFWEHQDIPLENIDRIEVIRGPCGSIWGANAVNGIINIITRSARDTQGESVSLAAGDGLRASRLARYGWALGQDIHARLHTQTKSVEGGRSIGGEEGPDNWKTAQAGFRLDALRGNDTYSLQGSLNDYRAGDRLQAFLATPPLRHHHRHQGGRQDRPFSGPLGTAHGHRRIRRRARSHEPGYAGGLEAEPGFAHLTGGAKSARQDPCRKGHDHRPISANLDRAKRPPEAGLEILNPP